MLLLAYITLNFKLFFNSLINYFKYPIKKKTLFYLGSSIASIFYLSIYANFIVW